MDSNSKKSPFDIAIKPGGIALARIYEIFGPEGSGKTTFSFEVVDSPIEEEQRGIDGGLGRTFL